MKYSLRKNPVLKKLCIWAAIVLLFTLIFILTGRSKSSSKGYQAPPPCVVISKPLISTVKESITLSGYVEAKTMIPVVPFVSGTITEYNVQAGDFIEKDSVIAKIDDAPFKQSLLQAEAAYFGYQSTFERIEKLYKSGATTQQNYDNAKAQNDAAKAQYDLAKLQYDYTEVKAPVSGTVLQADLGVGSIGSQSTPVAIIADMDNLVVRLKVPEKYFDLFMLEKDSITISVTRPGQKNMYEDATATASIENIAPYISADSKNFQVVCHIDDTSLRFRPGMYVKVTASYKTHNNVPIIPVTARKMDGSAYIYDPETKTVEYITLENVISDNTNFIVPDQYKDAYFVTDGLNTIFDGQVVTVSEYFGKKDGESEL
ncbi:MAG: efflux RND transporter periplasmic adaptor subunit [Treponema sp.]|nr:efflux RND transporter periplasmic adaptor subunit [Treponema sp.]